MANKTVWICVWAVVLSTLLLIIGMLGGVLFWFSGAVATGLVIASGIAIFVFSATLVCVLPLSRGR